MSSVSVIMISYHTGPALWLAIDSVLQQPECKELLLINNGNLSVDLERMNTLSAKDSRVIVVSGQGNVGFAKGCNLGVARATGEFILLLNPDSMLEAGALTKAVATLQAYPEETLAGAFIVNPDGTEQRGGRRALLNASNAISESLGLHRFFKNKERLNLNETSMPASVHEVPATSGAFMFIRRSFYNRLGGMDEGYFLHMEDMDFCYRVTHAGGKIIYMPQLKVLHFKSTSEVPSTFLEKHKARGFVRYLRTHFSQTHSAAVLKLLELGIWARFYLKRIVNGLDRFFMSPLEGQQYVARLVLLYRLSRFAPQDKSLEGKTLIVTGASGQIGLNIVGRALARGAQVIAYYHTTHIPFTHPNLIWLQGNLTKPETIAALPYKADILIHTASLWLLPDALPAFIDQGVHRIIAFSSTSLFTKVNSKNDREQEVVQRLKQAELDVKRICEDRRREWTILRPTMIYGAGLDTTVTRIANAIKRLGYFPLYMPAKGLRQPVQAADLARSALLIVGNPATYGKAYNLGGSEAITYRQMVEAIFKRLDKKPHLLNIPFLPMLLDILGMAFPFTYINGETARRMNQDLASPIDEAVRDFNYKPKAFLEGEVVL